MRVLYLDVGGLSSLFFGKHLDPLLTSDARDEDGLENISLTFKLSLNCNNGNVVCEIDSDSELEESDSEYTFTYEEVTDSELED